MIPRVLALIVLLAPTISQAQPQKKSAVTKTLERAEKKYRQSKWTEALTIAEEVLAMQDVAEPIAVRGHEIKAFSLFFLNLYPAAQDAWRALLKIKPDYKLDPVEHSPEMIAFFERVGAEPEKPPEPAPPVTPEPAPPVAPEPKAPPAPEPMPPAAPEIVTTTARGCGVAWCLIPFGVGQFKNDRPIKGSVFAFLSAASLVANIGIYQARKSEFDRYGYLKDIDGERRAYVVQTVAFGVFALSTVAGIADAFLWP